MTNLPNWKAADKVYSRSYRILANMARNGHVGYTKGLGCSVSQEMRDFITALDKGDEETIKWFNLRYLHHLDSDS